MAHVGKVVEIIGSSDKSWQDAAQVALEEANKTFKGITGVGINGYDPKS